MDKRKPSNERGNVRYLWVLIGGYLLYLAYQQIQLLLQGEVTKPGDTAVCVVSGAVFAGVGAWVIWREWRAWKYAQAHKDDPETWSNDPETDAFDAPELSATRDAPELAQTPENTDADEVSETPENTDAPKVEDADEVPEADTDAPEDTDADEAEAVAEGGATKKEETP